MKSENGTDVNNNGNINRRAQGNDAKNARVNVLAPKATTNILMAARKTGMKLHETASKNIMHAANRILDDSRQRTDEAKARDTKSRLCQCFVGTHMSVPRRRNTGGERMQTRDLAHAHSNIDTTTNNNNDILTHAWPY